MDTILLFASQPLQLYADCISGIQRRLGAKYQTINVDYAAAEQTVRLLLDFWHPAGCIVFAAEGLGRFSPGLFGNTPVVYLDRTPRMPGNHLDVTQDYADNGRVAARELLACGLPAYAFVCHKGNPHWSRMREKSFVAAVRMNRRPCRVFADSPNRPQRLNQWLRALPKPVGVFTASDRTAIEVLTICRRNRIRIPEDISLLGIDNELEICESANPPLTSITSDFERGGWLCADLLLERIRKPSLRKCVRLYQTLGVIRRASTRRSSGMDRLTTKAVGSIRARACDGITVDDVAAEMGISRRMAEIRFRQQTGKTIKSQITEVRLERAKVLLKDKGLSLGKITELCGYKTENALRIAFKKAFGTTLSRSRPR